MPSCAQPLTWGRAGTMGLSIVHTAKRMHKPEQGQETQVATTTESLPSPAPKHQSPTLPSHCICITRTVSNSIHHPYSCSMDNVIMHQAFHPSVVLGSRSGAISDSLWHAFLHPTKCYVNQKLRGRQKNQWRYCIPINSRTRFT